LRVAAIALLLCAGVDAKADVVKVFAAGAAKEAVVRIAPLYRAASGNTLAPVFDTVGALRDRVAAGERPDVVILSSAAVDALLQKGLVAAAGMRTIGVVSVSIAVRKGASVPDVSSSPDAFRQALLAAKSIAYADPARGATAGTHFAKVLEQLGLIDLLRERITVLPFGVDVIEAVAAGRFDLGVSQSSEILQSPGVAYAGALPTPFALTTPYAAAAVVGSTGAAGLLEFLALPASIVQFRATGFGQP
jgi:molybdate transport system substrate-binding protein